jgi:hypothetical protein
MCHIILHWIKRRELIQKDQLYIKEMFLVYKSRQIKGAEFSKNQSMNNYVIKDINN